MEGIMVVLIVIIILITLIFVSVLRYKNAKKYSCPDGEFIVFGKKGNCRIHKDNRFIFFVKNGQIVSFIDKSVNKKVHNYSGGNDGNI